jgi:3-hydroxyisobutyrate dehydrogenase-like beta-hydroxyacid dehydrogenase
MSESIGFIGLGHMGEPMARNLLKAGFAVRVYNRTSAKAQALASEGARAVGSPAEAAQTDGIVITMLANDAALEEVVLGQKGIGQILGKGGVHLSMSTVSPETARRLAAVHAERGALYLAAPVFGRPEAAAAGKLWICLAGDIAAKRRVQPVLAALGQGVHDFGEQAPAANVVKLAGNFLILSAIEALAEAFTLAEKNGIQRDAMASFFGQTIFACPIYQNYGRIVATEQYTPPGFRLSLGMKDINLVLDSAQASRTPMPLASLLHNQLLHSLAKGREDLDWAAIALAASEAAGIK